VSFELRRACLAENYSLADMHHNFLNMVLDPLVPSSMHTLAVKYNIAVRLWQIAFHILLERLRHAWISRNPDALGYLIDVIEDAYRFYTFLLEDINLATFRTAWLEALGDLARYRMAIAASLVQESSTRKIEKVARIDDDEDEIVPSSGASIGAEVADSWEVEDKETWRTTAKDWYSMGITEKPGEGRLHHHLALLSRDVRGGEGRALYHFVKR
jgi:protein SMG6